MNIAEIFHSIQGEGALTGTPSVFVRTSGCNLRCHWCDTPYTSWSPEGELLSVDEIVEKVAGYNCPHVVLTGGEPMIVPDITDLTHRLKDAGHHLTIETAATVYHDVACDLASLSPKLSNSTPHDRDGGSWADRHEQTRINLEVIRTFIAHHDHQLKFVIESESDLAELDQLLAQIGQVDRTRVQLMPEGIDPDTLADRSRWLARVCIDRGFRFCPRVHIMLFGNTRGT